MKILITGAAGYIGKVLVEYLYGRHDLYLHDKRTDILDKIDKGKVVGLDERIHYDLVVHTAAKSLVRESYKNIDDYLAGNNKFLFDVLSSVDCSNFTFISSANVYKDSTTPLSNYSAVFNNSPYGSSKLIGEDIVKRYSDWKNFNYTILRLFNVAGAGTNYGEDHDPETHLIPCLVNAVLENRPPLIRVGNILPFPVRDYVHVLDVCQAIEKIFGVNEVFNISGNQPLTNLQVWKTVRYLMRSKIEHETLPANELDPDFLTNSDQELRILNKRFGFKPQYNVEDMIKSHIRFINARVL